MRLVSAIWMCGPRGRERISRQARSAAGAGGGGGAEGWVFVQRDGVVDGGLDAVGGEVAAQGLSFAGSDDVEVVYRFRGGGQQWTPGMSLQGLAIAGGKVLAVLIGLVEEGEQGAQVAGVEFVQAGVHGWDGGDLTAAAASIAEEAEALGGGGRVGEDGSAVAEAAEVFGGVEAVADVGGRSW